MSKPLDAQAALDFVREQGVVHYFPTRRTALLAIGAVLAPRTVLAQPADPWAPIRRLFGEWSGTSSGVAGEAVVTRQYTLVLNGRFVNEVNISVYPPQEKNKNGERHEHWGMFSFDKARKTLVLRHFHQESFVNIYRHVADEARACVVVFESEAFENFDNAWKARESYQFVGDDQFVEVFELAAPGKPYQVYSRSQFKRAKR